MYDEDLYVDTEGFEIDIDVNSIGQFWLTARNDLSLYMIQDIENNEVYQVYKAMKQAEEEKHNAETETEDNKGIAFNDLYSAIGEFITANGTENFDVEGFSDLLVEKLGLTMNRDSYDSVNYDENGDTVDTTGYSWESAYAPLESVGFLTGDALVEYDLDNMEYVALIDDTPYNSVSFSVYKDTGEFISVSFALRFESAVSGTNLISGDILSKLKSNYGYENERFERGVEGIHGEYSDIYVDSSSNGAYIALRDFK